jgi:hypothetical protein
MIRPKAHIKLPRQGSVLMIDDDHYTVNRVKKIRLDDAYIAHCELSGTDVEIDITLTSKYPFETDVNG